MTRRSLRGDPSLIALLRTDEQAGVARRLLTTAARCWDSYGLVDGSRNPTRGSSMGVSYSMPPGETAVNEALNTVIRPHLPPKDRWLLDIPRVLLPGSASARMVVSRSGGVALGLPWALFGSLFFRNEVLITLQIEHVLATTQGAAPPDARRRRTHELLEARIGDGLPSILRHWVTGRPLPTHLAVEAQVLEMALDVWRNDRGRRIRSYVWAVTVIQQILMLLHEFGHVSRAAARGTHEASVEHDLGDLEEVLADVWGAERLHAVCDALFQQREGLMITQAIATLFGMFDEYREHEVGYARRCANLIRIVAPLVPTGVEAVTARWRTLRDLMDRPGLLSACYENLGSFVDMVSPDQGLITAIRRMNTDDGVSDRLEEHLRIHHGRPA